MYLYSGMEVASCVLEFSNKYKCEITNLMLQNILYYIQLNFLKKYHEPIFSDDIIALRFGPCVQDVYDRFNAFTRFPIYCPDIESCIDDIEVRILIHQVVNACKTEKTLNQHRVVIYSCLKEFLEYRETELTPDQINEMKKRRKEIELMQIEYDNICEKYDKLYGTEG